ncbi:hypothetical protein [Sorangium sp. So ce426]|uniref:hypothetical protein n=1 Tax=unclassified Sorangium TaxID=2621164 RepID=UPI003F5B6B1A
MSEDAPGAALPEGLCKVEVQDARRDKRRLGSVVNKAVFPPRRELLPTNAAAARHGGAVRRRGAPA